MKQADRFYTTALVLWILAFGSEVLVVAHHANTLSAAAEAAQDGYRALDRDARAAAAAQRESEGMSKEMEFLRDLPETLPQDKGYLRTQTVLLDDVRHLRSKLSTKMGSGLYIVVDAKADKLYLKKGLKLLWQADCSVGRGGTLVDKKSGRKWSFATPRGEFHIKTKIDHPAWKRPDWAYVEAGIKDIPPPDDPSRLVEGDLGDYALDLGDGYLIHGTPNEASLGRPVSHGCVRLGTDDLKRLYQTVPVGTRVYIYY